MEAFLSPLALIKQDAESTPTVTCLIFHSRRQHRTPFPRIHVNGPAGKRTLAGLHES